MRFLIMLGRVLAFVTVLAGCSKQQPQSFSAPVITTDAEHNRCCEEANRLTTPYFRLSDTKDKPATTRKAQADLRRGIALYQAIVRYAPTNWSAYWCMGKAHQALEEHEAACDAFGKAFAIQKNNADVGREYMFECLELGRASEAISAAEHALLLQPHDAGLLANLALAYTLAGRNSDALAKVEESLAIEPNDKITLHLKRAIREIVDGKRPHPKRIRDLEQR
jgi:tetratricopeptide (TPR) repeat protein